jgi:hypothetical protein
LVAERVVDPSGVNDTGVRPSWQKEHDRILLEKMFGMPPGKARSGCRTENPSNGAHQGYIEIRRADANPYYRGGHQAPRRGHVGLTICLGVLIWLLLLAW